MVIQATDGKASIVELTGTAAFGRNSIGLRVSRRHQLSHMKIVARLRIFRGPRVSA